MSTSDPFHDGARAALQETEDDLSRGAIGFTPKPEQMPQQPRSTKNRRQS